MNRAALLLSLALTAPAFAQPADLVLKDGVIHTLDPKRPEAKALAVRGERILAVGDGVDPAWVGETTRVIDLKGACVVPGLWDAHAHLLGLGLSRARLDLAGTESFAEVVAKVRAEVAKTPKGTWIQGRGWDQNDWPEGEFGGGFPVHAALSAVSPDHPVVLRRIDGHAALVNAKALALSGIGPETPAPSGGEILMQDGQPTGVLVDAAMSLVDDPPISATQVKGSLLAAAKECLSYGMVGVHDAGVSHATVKAYRALYEAGELPFRVYVMLRPSARRHYARPVIGAYGGRLTVRAVKRFMDGALGSRGAYLLAPYSDRPDTRGLPQVEPDAFEAAVRQDLAHGFQTCTHAIGDGGVRRVLDAYAAALAAPPQLDPTGDEQRPDARLRVEHAQVIALDDIPRFAKLGVLPSMQPTHATSDMPWAEKRLGPERIKGAYAWQRLIGSGSKRLPLGSDFPVERPDVLLGFYAAVTRLTPDGTSPHGEGGWFPDQRLTRFQALKGFTHDAAYAAFMEKDTGCLAPGKWADIAVFDTDLMTCAAPQILKAKARYTIVAGQVAYERK